MREHKYRAWDRDCRRWLQDDEWALLPNGKVMIYDEADSVFVEADEGHFQAVEYTGLKDRNGVEIYEGDILFSQAVHEHWTVEWGAESDYCGFAAVRHPDGWRELFLNKNFSNCQVLGNIHENPELKEGKA